jgi:hypothetical protein
MGIRSQLIFILLVVAGCLALTEIAPPVEGKLIKAADVRGVQAVSLQNGRHTYLTTCAKCHLPEPIAKYSPQEWSLIIPRMSKRSRLCTAEVNDLTNYLLVAGEAAD